VTTQTIDYKGCLTQCKLDGEKIWDTRPWADFSFLIKSYDPNKTIKETDKTGYLSFGSDQVVSPLTERKIHFRFNCDEYLAAI